MDIIGQAASNYFYHRDQEAIQLIIDGHPDGEMPPSVFFRPFSKLKVLEKQALELCYGSILDVGACGGNYSLELKKKHLSVTSLDISPLLCKIMRDRGLSEVIEMDVLQMEGRTFDTILLMMNGFGIARELALLPRFLAHLKTLLAPGGQIIGDTTDIAYFREDQIIRGRKTPHASYPGNVIFKLSYKEQSEEFRWVYPDPESLISCAKEAGLQSGIIKKGKDFSYLMRLEHGPA